MLDPFAANYSPVSGSRPNNFVLLFIQNMILDCKKYENKQERGRVRPII